MPLTGKGNKIMGSMKEQYGKDKGESVFYASKNKGTIKGVEKTSMVKLSELSTMDLAYIEGVIQKCAEHGVDGALLLGITKDAEGDYTMPYDKKQKAQEKDPENKGEAESDIDDTNKPKKKYIKRRKGEKYAAADLAAALKAANCGKPHGKKKKMKYSKKSVLKVGALKAALAAAGR